MWGQGRGDPGTAGDRRGAEPTTPGTVEKHLEARRRKRAMEMDAVFGLRKLSKMMGQPESKMNEAATLLPDSATARAAAGGRKGSARSIPPEARALMLCVRHVYGGSHLDTVRARVAGVEPAQISLLVGELRLKHGQDLCDTPTSLALSRAVASVCAQPTTGMFTVEELDECL